MFFHRHSFARLVFVKSWLKCWKPVDNRLGTLGMIPKRQTTGMCFHQVCETKIYDNLFKSTSRNYSLFRHDKNEVLINLQNVDWISQKNFFTLKALTLT